MIIFLDSGGNIVATSAPDKVGRNSNDATSFYIVAPFKSATSIYLTFKLPNGQELFGGVAHEGEELPYEDAAQKAAYLFTSSGFSVWRYKIPASVTLYAGNVQYTIVTLTESMRATATGSFTVARGNRVAFPDAEPENAWELLKNQANQNADAIETLEGEVNDLKNQAPSGLDEIVATISRIEQQIEGKLDKITDTAQAGNFGGAYILNKDGTQGMTPISNTTDGGTIPVRETGGAVVVGTPTADSHAASKGYVDGVADTKLDKFTVEGNAGDKVYVAKSDGTQTTTFIGDGEYYIARYLDKSVGDNPTRGYLWGRDPVNPYHVATKNYVDKAVATVQGQLDTLGTFYEVVKVYSSGTIFVDIPTGAMATAYIESADFYAYNTDGTLVHSGTANGLYFLDENWMDISFISFTAPAYIQIPENARQIRVNCDELVPDNVGWDAGPLVFSGAVYFQVKRGN